MESINYFLFYITIWCDRNTANSGVDRGVVGKRIDFRGGNRLHLYFYCVIFFGHMEYTDMKVQAVDKLLG